MYGTDKEKIGKHLLQLIKLHYDSSRQFAKDYIKRRYNDESTEGLANMQNRISGIINGKKWIQIEDLPYFAEMLRVSVDEILSAGEYIPTISERPTNYSIAQSKDPSEWEKYIDNDQSPFLNPDEYNKTILDYAMDFENTELLTYLMEKGYVWFVGKDKREYGIGFGAGTSIQRRDVGHNDSLNWYLKEHDELRLKMIGLAIKAKNYKILDELHAREIPRLYMFTNILGHHNLKTEPIELTKEFKEMITTISLSDDEVISYFFKPYDVESSLNPVTNTFIFPFIGSLLEVLIKNKHPKAKEYLQTAINYNKSVHKRILKASKEFFELLKADYKERGMDYNESEFYKKDIDNRVFNDYYTYPKPGFVSYSNPINPLEGFITNLIHINVSSDETTNSLIKELNSIFDSVMEMKKEV